MNPLHAVFTLAAGLTSAQRRLVVCAALLAGVLLLAYVQTLQRWMTRGAEMREAQRSFVIKSPAKVFVSRPQKVAQRRSDAQNADPRAADPLAR